jgi:hypothetical protein
MHLGCSQPIDFWSFKFNWSNKIWFWHTQHYLKIIHLYLLSSLLHKKCQVDFIVQEKMFCHNTNYQLSLFKLVTHLKFTIVQSLNICHLKLHFQSVFTYWKFFTSQNVCCFNETRMENINVNKQIHNILSKKIIVLFCYHWRGILMFYEKIILLLIITNHGVEFICATFSKNITKKNLKNNTSNCN